MTREPADSLDSADPLGAVLAACIEAVDRGDADAEMVVARYPEYAAELREFFAAQERAERLAAPLKPMLQATQAANAADAAAALPNRLGDFRLLREVGRGGMGIVYEAEQVSLGRRVALKVLRGGALADGDDVRRFRLETEAVANLDHPNIVPIYEVGEHDGLRYFAMKLIEGTSLAQRLAEYRPNPKAAASLLARVARAVHHAHQRGILYRDLKPANILIDAEGQPHVTDFGLAKRVAGNSELTQSGVILGTPSYMAPEQASGKNKAITTATDVYGLGAVLYALLAGKPPFKGDSVLETLEQVRQQSPEPPSGVGRNADRDLETICLKCLEKEPERRYGSALALAEDLERWLRGEPTWARPLSRPARLWRWAWRRRREIAVGAAALVMLVFIGLGAGQAIRLRQAGQLVNQQQSVIHGRDAEARQAQYVSDIRRASILIAQIAAKEARELLDRHGAAAGAEDLRGFEWSYLRGLTEPARASWVGHEGKEVYHVEYAPDGRTFVTAGQDRTARTLKTADRPAHETYARLAPDGSALAVGERIEPLAPGTKLEDCRFKTVIYDLSGRRGPITLPPVAMGLEIVLHHCWSPDGRRIALVEPAGDLTLWDGVTGRLLGRAAAGFGRGSSSPAFLPAGDVVIAVCGDDRLTSRPFDLVVWKPATSQLDRQPILNQGPRPYGKIVLAPDGRKLAYTHRARAALWDLSNLLSRFPLFGHSNDVRDLAFAPDGRTLATASEDRTVRLWSVATGQELLVLDGHTGPVRAVAFSPDGRMLASCGDGPDGGIEAIAWYTDGSARASPAPTRPLPQEK